MKKLILIALIMTAQVMSMNAGDLVNLPQPDKSVSATLMQALADRHSAREFSSREISDATLSTILWAATGVNRPEEGKLTVPSAMNAKDIQVYVIRKDGAYLYNPQNNTLQQVTDKDLRSAVASRQSFAATAPVSLLMVSDHSRFRPETPQAAKERVGAIDAGYVSQNIALVCTALGLNNVPRMTMDTQALKQALNLTDQQDLVLNQQIGYPAE